MLKNMVNFRSCDCECDAALVDECDFNDHDCGDGWPSCACGGSDGENND